MSKVTLPQGKTKGKKSTADAAKAESSRWLQSVRALHPTGIAEDAAKLVKLLDKAARACDAFAREHAPRRVVHVLRQAKAVQVASPATGGLSFRDEYAFYCRDVESIGVTLEMFSSTVEGLVNFVTVPEGHEEPKSIAVDGIAKVAS